MKAYVICPNQLVTGGPEAIHQLASSALAQGYAMAIKYWPREQSEDSARAYAIYDVDSVSSIPDEKDSLVIVSEVDTGILRRFKKAEKLVWWLSVDNYFKNYHSRSIKRYLTRQLPYALDAMSDLHHAAQSEYARVFLNQQGLREARMLTDHLRPEFLSSAQEQVNSVRREDRVLYNPAKGIEFTQRLMAAAPDIEWLPLRGLTSSQLTQLMLSSKAYIDFGHHPGRDRMPREAGACGCCILVGLEGSAGNTIDMPIEPDYKFNQEDAGQVDLIAQRLRDIFSNYDHHRSRFSNYRVLIHEQEAMFHTEVKALCEHFGLDKAAAGTVGPTSKASI